MTREDAIRRLENISSHAVHTIEEESFIMSLDDGIAIKMAIEALEQENVLDEVFENIKTEIDFIPTYGAKFADGSINVHVNKKDVLQIIDKYKAESEE